MLEACTDRALRVWGLSRLEAFTSGATEVSNEHVLLAILRQIDLPEPGSEGRRVHESECLAGVVLRCGSVDLDLLEHALRGGVARPDLTRVDTNGASLPNSRGVTRALRSQLHSRKIRHGIVLDTAQQLVSSVANSRTAGRAIREAGLRHSRPLMRLPVSAIAEQRCALDAQARTIFSAAEIEAFTRV